MSEREGRARALKGEQKPAGEESPAEKLQDPRPVGSQTPGVENPESEEIRREINPNTE